MFSLVFLVKKLFFLLFLLKFYQNFVKKVLKIPKTKKKMLLLIGFWLKNYTILFEKDKNQWFLLIFCIFLLKLTINFSKLLNFLLFAQLKP